MDIGVEANPYYYKVTSGKERELQVPLAGANIGLIFSFSTPIDRFALLLRDSELSAVISLLSDPNLAQSKTVPA